MTEAYEAGFRKMAESYGVDPTALKKAAGVLNLAGRALGAAVHPVRTVNRTVDGISDVMRNVAVGGSKRIGDRIGEGVARYFQLLLGGSSKKLAPINKSRMLRDAAERGLKELRAGHVGSSDWASSAAARSAADAGDMKALRRIRRANKPALRPDEVNGWANQHTKDLNAAAREWWKARAVQGGTLAGAGGLYAYNSEPEPDPEQDGGALTALRGLFGG